MALEYPTGPLPVGFPAADPTSLEILARIHHALHGAWFLDSGPGSRFNLNDPWGTCYTAEVDLGAFMEKFVRVSNLLSETALYKFRISHFETDPRIRIADFTDPLAKAAGVTAEIHSTTDYKMTQAWARSARDAGFDGVRYFAASDPSCTLVSVALFSERSKPDLEPIRTSHIPDELLRQAEEQFGLLVLPAVLPRSEDVDQLRAKERQKQHVLKILEMTGRPLPGFVRRRRKK